MSNKRGLLVVFSGPSGSGKGTVLKEALKRSEDLAISVSVTTRQPRAGEQDGVDYIFYSKEKFESLISEDGFLEWACFCENYYGTPKAQIEAMLSEGETIQNAEGKNKVWVKEGSVLKAMPVKTGLTNGTLTQVLEGLAPGTEIITEIQVVMPEGEEKQMNTNPFMPQPRNRNQNQKKK